VTAKIIVIAGPTASGKSALGLRLAQRFGGEILNADSQQVYRGLDIGTGKPTAADRALVPHHLFDIAEPWEQLNAARYLAEAERALVDVASRGRPVFVIGGTGLWLRALVRGLVDAPGKDEEIRSRLEAEAERDGLDPLIARLRVVDPVTAANIQGPNRVRVIRALEVFELAGVPLSVLHAEHRAQPPRHVALELGMDPPRAVLDERIATRARAMFEGGLLEETQTAARDDRARPRLELVMGYREALQHLRGETNLDEAIRLTAIAQRQYSRRQRNWFRHEPQWKWLPDEATFDHAAGACETWLRE
jgi:tRNA dimethylallyltransferase